MSYPGIDQQDIPEAFRNPHATPVAGTRLADTPGTEADRERAEAAAAEAFRVHSEQVAAQTARTKPPTYGEGWNEVPEFDFQTPSGTWCRIRKVDEELALSLGLINHLDVFSAQLMQDANGKKRTKAEIEQEMMQKLVETGKTDSFFQTVNKIVCAAVIQPNISMEDDAEFALRRVPLADKMAIFNACFGNDMAKIAQFRGQADGMGDVESVAGVQGDAEQPSRNP